MLEQVVELARWGKGSILKVAYSPDGKLLAVATSIGIYLYDANTLDEVRFIDSSSWVSQRSLLAGWGLAGQRVSDGTVKLWRVADGSELHTMAGHTGGVSA
jgi:WD40 repeat protein